MMIPPLDRCRPRQGLNLQLPSFDGRVFRRNRTLTASEKVSGRKSDKETTGACQHDSAVAPAPLEPFPGTAFAAPERSFSHPILPKGTGTDGGGSSLIFTAQKMEPGEIRPRHVNVLYH